MAVSSGGHLGQLLLPGGPLRGLGDGGDLGEVKAVAHADGEPLQGGGHGGERGQGRAQQHHMVRRCFALSFFPCPALPPHDPLLPLDRFLVLLFSVCLFLVSLMLVKR